MLQNTRIGWHAQPAVEGASLGEAFMADAGGANHLGKVDRYETHLLNNLPKCMQQLEALNRASLHLSY